MFLWCFQAVSLLPLVRRVVQQQGGGRYNALQRYMDTHQVKHDIAEAMYEGEIVKGMTKEDVRFMLSLGGAKYDCDEKQGGEALESGSVKTLTQCMSERTRYSLRMGFLSGLTCLSPARAARWRSAWY